MTKRLEEEFNLPPMPDSEEEFTPSADEEATTSSISTLEEALSVSEKINSALAEVSGMEVHDSEMDDIAEKAVESYKDLMDLGMNMTDMAAGGVFNNAAAMLKIALDAKDSKVTRKLKQVDLMLKKANLDARVAKQNSDDTPEATATILDRNELLKLLGKK